MVTQPMSVDEGFRVADLHSSGHRGQLFVVVGRERGALAVAVEGARVGRCDRGVLQFDAAIRDGTGAQGTFGVDEGARVRKQGNLAVEAHPQLLHRDRKVDTQAGGVHLIVARHGGPGEPEGQGAVGQIQADGAFSAPLVRPVCQP